MAAKRPVKKTGKKAPVARETGVQPGLTRREGTAG